MRNMNCLLALLIIVLLSGCYASYFHPVTHLPPSFEKEGDMQLNVGLGSSEVYPQFNVQSTYAFDSARFGSVSLFVPFPTDGYSRWNIVNPRSYYFDVGYGRRLFRSKAINFYLQGTTGYGIITISKSDYFTDIVTETRRLDYLKFNVIPTLSWYSENVEIGVNAKGGMGCFVAIHEDLQSDNFNTYFVLDEIKANRFFFDFQPSIYAAFGLKSIKLIAQYSLLFPNERITHDFVYASIGLKFFLNTQENFNRNKKK